MPFGNIATFYIPETGGSVGAGGTCPWGIDVQRFLDAPDPDADTTTGNAHDSNSNEIRVFNPFDSGQRQAVGQSVNFGWGLHPTDDMNSVAGALRAFRAGNHTLIVYVGSWGLLGSNHRIRIVPYRVASAAEGYTRTQLSAAGEGVANALGGQVAVSVNLPELVFEPGESIQYAIQSIVNTGLSQNNASLHLGTSSALNGSVVSRIETPGLITLAPTKFISLGSASVDGVGAYVLPTLGASEALAIATGSMGAVASQIASSAGVGDASGELSALAQMQGQASGNSSVVGENAATASLSGHAFGSGVPSGDFGARAGFLGQAQGGGIAHGSLKAFAGMTALAEAAAIVAGFASSVAGTIGSGHGDAAALGESSIVLGTVGDALVGEGGGDTIVQIFPPPIFDD